MLFFVGSFVHGVVLEQTRRNRILEPVQHLLISDQSPVPSRTRDCTKLLSLGPPPPISFTVYQGMRYMTLQRTWAGVSVPGTGITRGDTKTPASNNDPFDLLKYQCRTQIVERHIQPQFRREPSAGWQNFDSEVPWHRGTGFQRDFRRATVQQHDLMQQTNSQTQRTRAPLQADGRTSQAKSENINPPAEPVKSVNKEKVNDQATRESASKKRKSVPDVVVADSYSPKKKSKTINNAGAHALASKQPKKK